jgi:endonuclease/exonuclease/phosphatase family metal-dependent hydrolase
MTMNLKQESGHTRGRISLWPGVVVACLLLNSGILASAQTVSDKPVRVMSFNIRYGTAQDGDNHWDKRKEFLADTLDSFEPDLLGTQETLAFQRDFISQKMQGFEAFSAGRDDGKEAGEMAALFYRKDRFEKLSGGHFWLSETPDIIGSKGWDAALPRIATWVKLRDRQSTLTSEILFLNTHFDHRGVQARENSARLIRDKIGEVGSGCRIVITGDFNAGVGSDPYLQLFGESGSTPSVVVDTFLFGTSAGGNASGTFSGFRADNVKGPRIDWIACSRDWEVRLAGIDRTARDGRTPSDHFPVTAVLRARLQPDRSTLRVLSYNIHHGEGTDGRIDLLRIAKVIRNADPDLVALQEVDNLTTRALGVDQTSELKRLTGLNGSFGKAIDYSGGEYGQAILSRFEVPNKIVHALPSGDREQRIAMVVPFPLMGKEALFASTHLDHANEEYRHKQAIALNGLFPNGGVAAILAGDLNATDESKTVLELKRIWTFHSASKPLLTFPASKPTKQIDYVVARNASGIRAAAGKVLEESIASDHRPILMVFEID